MRPLPATAATDDELYRDWALGDRRAGSVLVDRYVRPLARFFVNKVASTGDAEDLTAETLEILARRLGEFAGRSSVRTWVFAIAHNVLRNHLRRRGGHEPFDESVHAVASIGPSPITALARRRELQRLLSALRAIPLMFQVVLELTYFEQLSRSEIADALALPPGTVASRLRRAHELLAIELGATATDTDASNLLEMPRWAAQLREMLTRGAR
ncbi:MAG TPA: sigma-70 family RNA polymerase sigma factor [Nannocystaceae bacterium]|nr:sigma-70 family RNA polymerase sigma factor [Nannocystaceae bacterium]